MVRGGENQSKLDYIVSREELEHTYKRNTLYGHKNAHQAAGTLPRKLQGAFQQLETCGMLFAGLDFCSSIGLTVSRTA